MRKIGSGRRRFRPVATIPARSKPRRRGLGSRQTISDYDHPMMNHWAILKHPSGMDGEILVTLDRRRCLRPDGLCH